MCADVVVPISLKRVVQDAETRAKNRPLRAPNKSRSVLQLADEWTVLMEERDIETLADLARLLRVSRARVVQVMGVRKATPKMRAALERLEANGILVNERRWRDLRVLSEEVFFGTVERLMAKDEGAAA